ncbi:rhodopsin kinase, partial [Reticulomyxa filosa]
KKKKKKKKKKNENKKKVYTYYDHMPHFQVTVREFHQMRMLGRGAFGCVNACKKRDTGKLYAMKQINKKRVQGTDSVEAIMSERNFLADIGVGANDCRFVTTLKYAFMDENTLYLILDLMIGGDLKYHLNHERVFNEERSRFYAAQVLLGLEHIHNKGIVYRDLKLENILMDDRGNIKLSDLGLAVRMRDEDGAKKEVRGYAGTPGYTAPEVVLGHFYDHIVDFFSLGVMIYRFLCGKKPFQSVRRHHGRDQVKDDKQRNQTAELDRNVVEMEPSFPLEYFSANARSLVKGLLCKNPRKRLGANGIHEIKQHPWFDLADFGLLEAGYLDPPFTPSLDEIHAEGQQNIGRPPQDDEFQKIKLTPTFEKSLEDFSYVNKVIIQEEIVEVLKKVNATEGKRQGHNHADTLGELPLIGDPEANGDKQSCMARCSVV